MNDIIYKSRFLSALACFITRVRYRNFNKEVEKRASCDIFDYKRIAQPLPKYFEEILTDNNCFGMGRNLRIYSGVKNHYITSFVEHGYFFGKYVPRQETITFAKQILTFGDIRKETLESQVKNKRIIPIGPYIHYAPLFYNEVKMTELKKKLGRTLLVFFSHAATGCSVNFDVDYIVSKIESIRDKFDTVIISLFWSDISSDIVRILEEKGYIIFSAGHRYDYYFLSRQKTIISLADVTMSNNIGTHIAYCTYMGKPHWIVRQEITYVSKNGGGEGNLSIVKQIKQDPSSFNEKEELMNTFADYKDCLSDEQKRVASKYFGFNHIKSQKQMRNILLQIIGVR